MSVTRGCRAGLAFIVVLVACAVAPSATTPAGATPPPASGPFPLTCTTPSDHLVDAQATTETRCVYAAIERSGSTGGNLPIGQQLDTAHFNTRHPVSDLAAETYAGVPAATPAVIGSDLGAFQTYLDQTDRGSANIVTAHIAGLVADAQAGRLVTLSWHARSPFTGGNFRDRTVIDLPALLDERSPAGRAWLASTNQVIGVLRRFADAGVPVAFRPFHEANLRAFWWGQPDPEIYRQLWDQLQARVAAAGLHNVIWVYSANQRYSSSVGDMLSLLPRQFDVFGIDTYDDEATDATDRVPLSASDDERIVALGKPVALTEVGPINSADGRWDPATVTNAVSRDLPNAAWAMFWATFSTQSRMAIVDLVGHGDWWSRCPDGTCPTGRVAPSPFAFGLSDPDHGRLFAVWANPAGNPDPVGVDARIAGSGVGAAAADPAGGVQQLPYANGQLIVSVRGSSGRSPWRVADATLVPSMTITRGG